jgi:malonate-semialdehyde dehydrogenase (acetylating)/methylmalonate-semialdehyde dehydrogenase
MGPYATKAGRENVRQWIDQALKDGCKLVLDGRANAPKDYPKGFFMGPTILEGADVDMPSARQEAFGAVAALIRGESLDQAIDWINTKTDVGHSACIMTQSGKHARTIREVNVGNVGVNLGGPTLFVLPAPAGRRSSER